MKTQTSIILVLLLASVAARAADDPVPAVIQQLGAAEYAERESAQRELTQRADAGYEPVLKACASVYRGSRDPEVRHRLYEVMKQVVDKHPFRAPRGFLGVTLGDFRGNIRLMGGKLIFNSVEFTQVPQRPGIWVTGVIPDSGAAKAGVQANDLIIAINGKSGEVGDSLSFSRMIQSMKPGTEVKLSLLRAAQTNEVTATLGELPAAERERVLSDQAFHEFFAKWWEQNIHELLPEEAEE